MKNLNKTVPTPKRVDEYLSEIEDLQRKNDCIEIYKITKEITGVEPKMWGSIVGYGKYHYKYESGREGDFLRAGFSNRKSSITIYIMPGYLDLQDKLEKLGKYKLGKSCLYIKKLSDVNIKILSEIIKYGWDYMNKKYPN